MSVLFLGRNFQRVVNFEVLVSIYFLIICATDFIKSCKYLNQAGILRKTGQFTQQYDIRKIIYVSPYCLILLLHLGTSVSAPKNMIPAIIFPIFLTFFPTKYQKSLQTIHSISKSFLILYLFLKPSFFLIVVLPPPPLSPPLIMRCFSSQIP